MVTSPENPTFEEVDIKLDIVTHEYIVPSQWIQNNSHFGYIYSLLISPLTPHRVNNIKRMGKRKNSLDESKTQVSNDYESILFSGNNHI